MKIAVCRLFVLCMLSLLVSCNLPGEGEILMYRARKNVTSTLKDKYGLEYIGWDLGGSEGLYDSVNLHFKIFKVLSEDEGNEIVTKSAIEFLKEVNSNPKIKPYLSGGVFTPDMLTIRICTYHPDGRSVRAPDIGLFSFIDKQIRYNVRSPGNENLSNEQALFNDYRKQMYDDFNKKYGVQP